MMRVGGSQIDTGVAVRALVDNPVKVEEQGIKGRRLLVGIQKRRYTSIALPTKKKENWDEHKEKQGKRGERRGG